MYIFTAFQERETCG